MLLTMANILWFKLCIIHYVTGLKASSVSSDAGIYVSRVTGNDTTTCGSLRSPCRSISYGIHQVSAGSRIFLDGTATFKDPYTCQALDPRHPGIYLNKSVSFVGIRSRVYISCRYGNQWLVDGTELEEGVRVSFSGMAFLNTSLHFFDAFVQVSNTLFAKTEFVCLNFEVFNLPRLEIALNGVNFRQNAVCMQVYGSTSRKILINITNSFFHQNGKEYFLWKAPSIIFLICKENVVDFHISNSSFKKNSFVADGMIVVQNVLGTTRLLLQDVKMDENAHNNQSTKIADGLFFIISIQLNMTIQYGFVHRISGTFLTVSGQSSQIYVSNFEVDDFYSEAAGGGIFDIIESRNCYLEISNSTFSNGKNIGTGAVVSILAPTSSLIIQNSIFQNISNLGSGGALFVKSLSPLSKLSNHSKNFFAHLCIINCSFSDCESECAGAVCVWSDKLFVLVRDSSFLRNRGKGISGGAFFFSTNVAAKIDLHNNYFLENSAEGGGIVFVEAGFKESSLNFHTRNVTFLQNKLHTWQSVPYGIVYLFIRSIVVNIGFKDTRFIRNFAAVGSSISFLSTLSTFHSKMSKMKIEGCIFRGNHGQFGTVFVIGFVAHVACINSIFISNNNAPCTAWTFSLGLNNATIVIINSTFEDNVCGALNTKLSKTSSLTIFNSVFLRNRNMDASGGAISVFMSHHDRSFNLTKTNFRRSSAIKVSIVKVLFQENSAPTGGILTVTNSKVMLLNCTCVNNFARFQGGLINTYGSSSMGIFNSVFKQTTQKIFIGNESEFMATSFLRIYGTSIFIVSNTTFNMSTVCEDPLLLVSTAQSIYFENSTVSSCPVGYNIKKNNYNYKGGDRNPIAALSLFCKTCDYSFYSLQRGTARGPNVDDSFVCTSCPRGADCTLPSIKSKSNFWGYYAESNPPKLAFTICPYGYCRSPKANGTNFNECQGKRTGIMCGMCSQGYTEALLSTYCTPIKDCNDYWFWLVFLALVFSMAVLLVFKPPFVNFALKHIFWFKRFTGSRGANSYNLIHSLSLDKGTRQASLSPKEQLKYDKRQFSRYVEIIFYFYQIAQLLLSSYSLSEFFETKFLSPVLGFFNFEPRIKTQGHLCPFPGLTPETKLLFKIAPVFGTLVAILLIYASHYFICRVRGAAGPKVSPYLQGCIKTIFLSYTTLANVGISLIRCVFVGGKDRWFYNGNITCYQWWQYASFIFNAFYVVPFIFVLAWASFKLHQHKITTRQFLFAIICPLPFLLFWFLRFVCQMKEINVEESQNLNGLKEMLLGPYKKPRVESKRGALYWQSILIARRFILVLIFCTVTQPSIRLFSMTVACVLVLSFHLKVQPFQNSLANNLETVSLLFLVILGLINLFKSVFVGSEDNIKGSLVTVLNVFQWLEIVILGLFPALLLILVCFAAISFVLRVLFVCNRSIFICLFKLCAQRWIQARSLTGLEYICEKVGE